jgi:FKBP-type peptidyl-prolyl cis-trans isomerase SlpA
MKTFDVAIGPKTRVLLQFAISLEDGTEIDSNFAQDPVSFTMGDGQLLPGFEKALLGLKIGDEKTVLIAPEDAFGLVNPDNVHWVPRRDFPDSDTLTLGLMLSFSDAARQEVPGVIVGFDGDKVQVDFNHPLAGRNLWFRVKIHSVSPVLTH